MRNPSDRSKRYPFAGSAARWLGLAVAGLVLVAAVSPVAGQGAPPEGSAIAVEEGVPELEALAREIGAVYEVLPVRGGVVLRPTDPDAGFRSVEITADGLALDGEPVDEEALRERLGETAEPVLRLAARSPEEWSRLPALVAAGPAPVEAPQVAGGAEPVEEAAATPERRRMRTGDKVSLAGGVTIQENEIANEVVVVAGPLRVEGEIEGGAVVVGGNAHIEGKVGRELMVVGGNVYLGPKAVVDGDINIMAGGRVHRQPGARVTGRINELGVVGPIFGSDDGFDFRPRFRLFRWLGGVAGELFFLVTLALLACLVVLFGQQAVEGIGETLTTDPWRSGAVGLVFQILFLPLLLIVVVLLAVSIIGIPLLILVPFALLGLCVAAFVGFVGSARLLGRKVLIRIGRDNAGPYLAAIAGVAAIGLPGVLSEIFELPFLGFLSGLLCLLWVLAFYAAWTFGFGALLVRAISHRQQRRAGRGLPPIPSPQPVEPGVDQSPD